ncbi:MAG: hypothetical protein IPI49_29205 [Myxococcales bacterium]|nr:hypothetical protein [Myxococcales bacterium]
MCYPGLHCTQLEASGASCVQPAAALACNSFDVLALCTDVNTGLACVKGRGVVVEEPHDLGQIPARATTSTLDVGGTCTRASPTANKGLECHC